MTWDQHVEKHFLIPGSQNKRWHYQKEPFLQVLFIALKGSSDEFECHPDTNVCVTRRPQGSTSHHHLWYAGWEPSFVSFFFRFKMEFQFGQKKDFLFSSSKDHNYIISKNPPRPNLEKKYLNPFNWPTAGPLTLAPFFFRLKRWPYPTSTSYERWWVCGAGKRALRKLPSPRFWIFKTLSKFQGDEFMGWLVSGWKLVGIRELVVLVTFRLMTFWFCWKDL